MLRSLLPALLLSSTAALAEVPRVATDIAPVQGLVASVMGDLGTPALLVPPGASPHDHALKPSEARALQEAQLVVWMGEALSPDMARKIDAIAGEAAALALFDLPGTRHLAPREDVLFGAADTHDEDHDAHAHDDHAAEDGHEDHDHDHDHDDHAAEDHGHDHAHGADDPHGWLDPQNARLWLGAIAEALAEADPDHADTYRANAAAAEARLDEAVTSARATLGPVQEARFVVFHDAYQYFEQAFGLQVLGALRLSDATSPSPARLAALRDALEAEGATCIFAEPQFDPHLIETVTASTSLPVAELDPLGSTLAPGADFYPRLIEDMAQRIATCAQG